MGKKITALCLAALLLLSACAEAEDPAALRLWFPTASGSSRPVAQAVGWEAFDSGADSGPVDMDALLAALLDGPTDDGLENPFPPDTQVLGWALDDGLLRLDLSAPYGELSGIGLTLADCCLTLTLCQVEGVERVRVTIDGGPVAARERQVFTPEDVIFTGAEEEPRQISAELYFPRAMGKGLGFETRELTLTEDDDLYAMIAQALMAGPEDPDLHTLLPEEAVLLGVWVDDGVCYVNFSDELLTLAPESPAEQNLLLYSVVDTMGNLHTVTAVQLLVEGERLPEFGGQEASLPLEPDFGLLSGG